MMGARTKVGIVGPGALAALGALALCLLLALTPRAQAAFEDVGCFAGNLPGTSESCKPVPEAKLKEAGFKFSEEVQLGGTGGMAVNYTGAGGVPAGTVYAATKGSSGGTVQIAMYEPKINPSTSELELKFALLWEVVEEEKPYKRCGPALGTKCEPRVEASPGKVDVDIDQATGNVYVFNGTFSPGVKGIFVFPPDGSKVIAKFGEVAPFGKTTVETPGQMHESTAPGAIAVNASGDVYLYDVNSFDGYHRLMKFRPKTAGKFDEYVYAGTAEDIGAGFSGQGHRPWKPVADAAGDIYVAPDEKRVEKYDASKPGAAPLCSFEFAKGGVAGITVDPVGETPFFFTYKEPKRLYQLGPCNPATGKFEAGGKEIIGETIVSPERDDLWGLAFDPVAKFTPTRPAGVLYGGAPNPVSNNGVGKGEPGQSSLGYIFAPPKAQPTPPKILSQSVIGVQATTAKLQAEVNPEGVETSYRFQYETEAEYVEGGESFEGATETPVGGAILGAGKEAIGAAAQLSGLSPDTTYRYRVAVESECSPTEPGHICKVAGAAQTLRTYPLEVAGLPDKRAWELVSPAQKNGGQVLPAEPGISSCGPGAECKPGNSYDHFPMQSAPGGNAVAYEGTAFSPDEGISKGNSYVARRDPTLGWQSVNLSPPLLQKEGRGFKAFAEDLSEALLGQKGPALNPAAPPEYRNLYTEETASPFGLEPLLTATPPHRSVSENNGYEMLYVGASSDLSRIFFRANDALTAKTAVAPAAIDGGATKFNIYEWNEETGQLALVNVLPGNTTTKAGASIGFTSTNAVSDDGSRAFFSDEAGQVYVREGGVLTRKVPDTGKFLSAATDGSKVLLANGHLYDLGSNKVTDLTAGKGGFEGVAGQSDDLTHVYFVDTAVLTGEEANSEGAKAQATKPNLYSWSGGTTRFVATLLAIDSTGNTGGNLAHTWSPLPSQRTAEASPAGGYLAFLSQAPLTGFDNKGPCGNDTTGHFIEEPCLEAFLYDSQTGELSCPSCNRSGALPLGWSHLQVIAGGEALPQPRYLADEGRLYFDSRDSLSLADTNEGVEDVYQYEPNGIGSCEREGGCVSLISAGTGKADSNLLAVDETGKNVFFTSRDQLVLKDKDELIDLYDAREGGGIASETETGRGECQGEACQPPVSAPNDPTPSSSAFEGAGNVAEEAPATRKPCAKGKVKRHGRCVSKKHSHHKRAHRNGRKSR